MNSWVYVPGPGIYSILDHLFRHLTYILGVQRVRSGL